MDFLDFLSIIDQNTKNSYLINNKNDYIDYDHLLKKEDKSKLENFIDELSELKKWEKKFENIHAILSEYNIMPDDETKYCVWLLLPYLKEIIHG